MADERIDIEVTDKVDGNIEKKILGIASASDKGFSAVQKLKSALKDVNTSAVTKLAAASASATNALAREMSATAKLTIARSREAEATARMAVSAQRLATEQAKTAAATLKAQAAADRAAAAKDKEANASKRLSDELAREASAQRRIIHDPVTITPASRPIGGPTNSSSATVAEQTNAMRRTTAPIVTPEQVRTTENASSATDRLNESLGKAGVGAGLARHQMVNLGYQLQDIVVSLQAGQAPLTVFIQQGSQIAGIAASSGIGLFGMAKAVWALIAPFTPLIALLAAAYFGFKKFTADSAAAHRPELERYAASLGLTSKEMRKLGNETVDANGKLKHFDTVTITMADSWNGFIATIKEGLASTYGPFDGATSYFAKGWDTAMGFVRNVFIGFYGLVMTLVKWITVTIKNAVKIIVNAALLISQSIIKILEEVLNAGVEGMNLLIAGYNKAQSALGFDKPVAEIGRFNLGVQSVTDNMQQLEGINIGETLTTEIQTADRTLRAFGQTWDRNNVRAAKARLRAAADAIRANRNPPRPKKPSTADPKTQADYLTDTNKKLDDELSRMKMLKQARDEQARMDQIEEEFIRRRMPLDAAQIAALRAKVHAIEEYKYVQAESDRIYEEAVGPLRTYNAVVQASAELLAQHAISSADAAQQTLKASRAFKEATDPLFAMNEEMDRSVVAARLYGRAVDQNSYAEQVRQAFLAKGIDLSTNATDAQKAEAAAIIAKNNALLQQQFIQTQVGEIVNPILEQQQQLDAAAEMYAELDRLRQTDVLNEEQAQRAKHALDAKFLELRTANMSATFGELAKLSSSGNAELAAIGKAAAVAQATMDGYVAVQKALASGPPPWNFIQAAAVGVATGAQVAGILSTNVGSFAQGGQFMVDGRAGVDNNNVNMNLSRGERVTVETAAQQRAADGAGTGERPLNVKVVNVTDPKDIEAALSDPDNDHLVLNVLRRNPSQAKALMGGGR